MRRLLFCCLAAVAACSKPADSGPRTAADALADAAATKTLPAETYVSPTLGVDVMLPGAWKGRYRAVERADTTLGARSAIEFIFVPDSGSKLPPRPMMTIRVFPKSAWAKVSKATAPIGDTLATRGDDVYVLSLVHENPYPATAPEAPVFDRMMISIAQGGRQVHVMPHKP
jgi:hypothetical protein